MRIKLAAVIILELKFSAVPLPLGIPSSCSFHTRLGDTAQSFAEVGSVSEKSPAKALQPLYLERIKRVRSGTERALSND
jgi:hypothetical protein